MNLFRFMFLLVILLMPTLPSADSQNPEMLSIRKNSVTAMGEKVAVHPQAKKVYFDGMRIYYELKSANASGLDKLAGELKKLYEGKRMAGRKVPKFSNHELSPDSWNAEECDRAKGGPVLQININRGERVVNFSFQKTCARPEM